MNLAELIAKVEGLTGPSREVDAIIADHFKSYSFDWSNPYFTLSLDAAIALCERVLPHDYGYGFHKSSFQQAVIPEPEKRICAEVWSVRDGLRISSGYSANHPAIALVLATLKALQKQEHPE